MRKTVKYIFRIVVITVITVITVVGTALSFSAHFIPYAKTKGVVVDSFQTAGTVVDNMDGSYNKLEINKSITVEFTVGGKTYQISHYQRYKEDCPEYYSLFPGDEVEVYYNPICPSINRLGT